MATRAYLAKGRRTSLTITPNLASEVARSAFMRGRVNEIVDAIAHLATDTCPVGTEDEHLPPGHDPGSLRDSQAHDVITTPTGVVGVVAYFAWWAHMVHNGTVHSHPNPWLLNAALSVLTHGGTA